jgi:hypothetical protein
MDTRYILVSPQPRIRGMPNNRGQHRLGVEKSLSDMGREAPPAGLSSAKKREALLRHLGTRRECERRPRSFVKTCAKRLGWCSPLLVERRDAGMTLPWCMTSLDLLLGFEKEHALG